MKTESMKNEKNKIEHTQKLCLIVDRKDRHIEFSVVDQGEGIQNMDKLFQAFYTTKSDGMGFGLAICRTVIENHGGKIWAENNPNGGATFRFRLPLETEQTQ
jgi:signal transduction histidine kinase